MATKVLLNRMSPLADNTPHHHPHHGYHLLRLSSSAMNISSRKRTASDAFAASANFSLEPTLNKRRCIATTTTTTTTVRTPPPMIKKHNKTILLTPIEAAKKQKTPKKSVRFNLQQNSSSNSFVPPPNPCNWYSADELQQIRKREAKVVRSLQQQNHDESSSSSSSYHYLHQLTCLLGVACGAYSPSASGSNIQKAQYTVANCDEGRGLEKELLGCIRHRRKQVVQTLLKNQLLLQQRGGSYNRPEFREKVLSLQYIKLSTPSAKLAQLMAQGDAMVVQQAQQRA